MKALLRVEAATDTVIDAKRKAPDPGLLGAAEIIGAMWLPGGPINSGGTLKVAALDSSCDRCRHRMGLHWTVGGLCRECGCKGWLYDHRNHA